MRRCLLLTLLLATSCGALTAPPQARQPTEPHFRVKGRFGCSRGSGTLWLDSQRELVRYDVHDRVFLKGRGEGFTAWYPQEKVFFVYDKRRERALETAGHEAARSRYARAAMDSGALGLQPTLPELLAHPCERAVTRLGAHGECSHSDNPGGYQSWNHVVKRRAGVQEGFRESTFTLGNEYDPRRGLILAEDYGSPWGSGSHSFHPEEGAEGSEVTAAAFAVPKGFREILTDAQLKALVLPTVGDAAMLPGAPWTKVEDYHDDYPAGDLRRTFSVTRERWYRGGFGKPEHEEVLIWRLHAYEDLGLQQPGVLQRLNQEHRLSNRFVNPKAEKPGQEPFEVDGGWTVVGSRHALWVKRVPGKDSRELLLRLARKKKS